MELQLLFLLLPIAALSGWWIGRRHDKHAGKDQLPGYRDDYFRGLNFVINEQPDKAIEVFLRMVEVDSETVDTHFALASLFRRRGEVDRAIRIHQNLIARPTLTGRQRRQAFFELARDYQSAGVLDRAEGLYQDLLRDKDFNGLASRQLLEIYQQERDWQKALDTAQRLRSYREFNIEPLLAHYHCEIAEAAFAQGDYAAALSAVRHAPREGDGAVRASLLEGKIALARGDADEAIKAFQRVEALGAEFVPETLEPLHKAYSMAGREAEWLPYLEALSARRPATSVVLAKCAEVEARDGRAAAAAQLAEFLNRRPTIAGVERLIALNSETGQPDKAEPLAQVAHRLMQAKPRYRCGYCGFSARTLYWQCPGCKKWGTIKPIYGIEGE